MKYVNRVLIIIILISLFISFPVTGQIQRGFFLDVDLQNTLITNLSGERAKDYVMKISRYHRIRGGGDGSNYNECVYFLEKELRQLMLEEVTVEKYKSDGFIEYLHWRSPVGWRVRDAKLYMVEPVQRLICDYSSVAVSLMPYSNAGNDEAEVVFVGEGKSDRDYSGIDVNGKIVFATGGGGATVHREAVIKRGALGVIVGFSNRTDRYQYPDLVEVNRLSPTGEERSKAKWGFTLSNRQTKWLKSFFDRGSKVVMRASVDAELFDGDMPVLSAAIKGKKYPEQEILLMAHLDHYKPGANDNASGSAGLMEIARTLMDLIRRDVIERPDRTLRFLWLPEMHGTMAYIDSHKEIGKRAIAGINLDMIGEDYGKCISCLTVTQQPFSSPSFIGDLVKYFVEIVSTIDMFEQRGQKYLMNYRFIGYSGGSDHVMFSDPTVGVPSVMVGHPDVFHHTSFDTPDKVDATEMKRSVVFSTLSALTIANADNSMAYNLANLVSDRGIKRLSDICLKGISKIRESYRSGDENSFHKTFHNYLKYIEIVGTVEKNNINAASELCNNEEMKLFIAESAQSLEPYITLEKDRLEKYYKDLCECGNRDPKGDELTELEIDAKKIYPERNFIGPVSSSYLYDKLGNDYLNWYISNRERIPSGFGSISYEIANFINGKNNVLWIRDAVSAEFTETDLEVVMDYIEFLKKLKMVTY